MSESTESLASFDAAARARQAVADYFARAPSTESLVAAIKDAVAKRDLEWLASQPIRDMVAREISHLAYWIGRSLDNEYNDSPGFLLDPKTVQWAARQVAENTENVVAMIREGHYPSLRKPC